MALLCSQDVALGGTNFISAASAQFELGTRGYTRDGRVFRYVLNGGVALVAGEVIQSPATVAGHLARAVHTTSQTGFGSTIISLTCGSTVAAAFYNEGYLMVASGAGQGLQYQIKSHPAVSTGATGAFTLYDDDAVAVAITATSTVSLIPNKYAGVIRTPVTTATGVVVGVACYPIAITQYGWIQTWGVCPVRGGDTNALGSWIDGVSSTAGRARGFLIISSTGDSSLYTGQAIGYLLQTNVDGQFVAMDLRIAP